MTTRVLFACGGSAGHINPALAMAETVLSRAPGSQILFAGAKGENLEHRLVPAAGFPLRELNVNSFRRSISPKSLRHNAKALYNIPRARLQARRILREFAPDLVVGTGGFATYAVLREAAHMGIATAIHESNVTPGLATRGLAAHVGRVMVGFEAARAHYRHPARVVVTGTPVRPAFFQLTRKEARAALGICDSLPLLVSFWGSLGATVMNRHMVGFIAREVREGAPWKHIHGAGAALCAEWKMENGTWNTGDVEVREYIDDMPTVMAAADLVLCRAGASTVNEILARAVPSVLVPSPNVTGDHQTPNARLLSDRGGAVLLPEADCSPDVLFDLTRSLLSDDERRREMRQNLAGLTPPDAMERIMEVFDELTG